MNPKELETEKIAGVLLHPTSLSGSSVCGTFGKPAREWLTSLYQNGIGIWQFLPLAPTDSSGSPYSSPSGFAFNPWLLDVEDLIRDGFLDPLDSDFEFVTSNNEESIVDFALADLRSERLKRLLIGNWTNQKESIHSEFQRWCLNQFWLEDHCIFMELRNQNQNLPWWEWPNGFNTYNKKQLKEWISQNQKNLLGHRLVQWHLDRQWQELRNLAKQLGVKLFGDLPFYVSCDSSDVWSNRSLFSVFEDGSLHLKSGVPPDYFSETGQLWGNPVYRWSRHRSNRFLWWRKRIMRHLEQVDLLRIDHFRAFEAFWAIPGADETAENGFWLPSPGREILNSVKKDCGGYLPLVAEDLGVITSEVEYLRDYFHLPGMKILQFAFDGNNNNPYLPENIQGRNWIVYTGTHDNSTTLGWWDGLNNEKRAEIMQYFDDHSIEPNWNLIKLGMTVDASIFITSIQDILSLNDIARFNKPGTNHGNWSWRLTASQSELQFGLKKYGQMAFNFNRSIQK